MRSLTPSSHGALVPKSPYQTPTKQKGRRTESQLGESLRGFAGSGRWGLRPEVGDPADAAGGSFLARSPPCAALQMRVLGRSPRGKQAWVSPRGRGAPAPPGPGGWLHCSRLWGAREPACQRGFISGKRDRPCKAGEGGLQASTREGNGRN